MVCRTSWGSCRVMTLRSRRTCRSRSSCRSARATSPMKSPQVPRCNAVFCVRSSIQTLGLFCSCRQSGDQRGCAIHDVTLRGGRRPTAAQTRQDRTAFSRGAGLPLRTVLLQNRRYIVFNNYIVILRVGVDRRYPRSEHQAGNWTWYHRGNCLKISLDSSLGNSAAVSPQLLSRASAMGRMGAFCSESSALHAMLNNWKSSWCVHKWTALTN